MSIGIKVTSAILFSLFTSTVMAQNTCTASNGDWNNTSTWNDCGGSIPQDGDIVIIPDNISVSVTEANQYTPDGTAPTLYIYVGEDDGDTDGGSISISGKLNISEGSAFIVYEHATTTAVGPGSSEKIRWVADDDTNIATLHGDDVAFTGPVTVTDGNETAGINDPLPVEFVSVEAHQDQSQINVGWTTASENNNDFFTVQRSVSNTDSWINIKNVDGAGNSKVRINYKFQDTPNRNGTYYYRIKQTDFDGTTTFSQIITIDFENNLASTVYPNPVDGTLTVEKGVNESPEIQLLNNSGKNVANRLNFLQYEGDEYIIDTTPLSPGIYQLIVGKQVQKIFKY